MENKLNITEQIFGLVEKVTAFLDKFGIIKLFKTVIAIILLYWIIILSFNPSKLFEMYDRYQDRVHKEKVAVTLEKQYNIKNKILDLHYHTGAMRTLVCSMHNGSESINGGYSFLKVSALFEECGDYSSVIDEYQNIHLSQFAIFNYLYKEEVFCGTIENLKEIDNKLYYRLVANGVKYVHIQSLVGEKGDIIGFLVLTWDSVPVDCNKVHNQLYKKIASISRLLE